MKKLNAILLWVGLGFLVYLVSSVGVREIWRELGLLGWGLIVFILGEGIAEMIHTVGWRCCLSEPHHSLSWWLLFRIRISGYAINYLTPTASMGGEVTKIALLATQGRGPQAVSGVLIEKASSALAQFLFVAGGSLFLVGRASLPRAAWVGLLLGSATVLVGVIAFMLLQKHGKLGVLIRWLDSRTESSDALRAAAASVTSVDDALRGFYRDRRRDLWRSITWHLAGSLVGVVQTWLFFHFLFQDASWIISAAAWTLAMWFDLVTFVVPLNVGTLEGSRILALRAVGCSSAAGLTYGLAVRMSQFVWSGIGLLLYGSLALPAMPPASRTWRAANVAHEPHGSPMARSENVALAKEQSTAPV